MNIVKIKILVKNCEDKEYSYLVLIHAKKHFLCQHQFNCLFTSPLSNVDEYFLSKELSGVDYNYFSDKAHAVSLLDRMIDTSNGRFSINAFGPYEYERWGLSRHWDDL